MRHRILSAQAHPDYRVDIEFVGGGTAALDLAEFIATGEVTEALRRDPGLFVTSMRVGGGGSWLGWANEVEIDADALWYQAHPEDLKRDYGTEAA